MSTFKSKGEVKCAHCSWRGRRDKLASHTSSKHESERPREKNQASLLSVLCAAKNADPNSKRPLNDGGNQSDEPCNKLIRVELEHRPIVEPLPSTSQNNDFVQIDNDTNINTQLSSINRAILCLNEKVSEILQKNQTKSSEQELSYTSTSSCLTTPEIEEFEAKLKLIRVSKSVTQICSLIPCLLEEAGMIKCIPCITNYKSVPKDIAVLKTGSFGQFFLPEEQQLIQGNQSKKFGNFKGHLIDHLKSSAHKWCFNFSEALEIKEKEINEEHEKIGLRVGRTAYTAIKEGKGSKFFERLLSLNELNNVDIGELNHSREFFREFRKNIFFTMKSKIIDFLSTKNPVTNQLPLVSITADKITKLHRTFQITCLITIVDGVQTCIIIDISPCATSHKGDALAKKIKSALDNFHIKLESQLNGMSFDGQYFDISVDKQLHSFCSDIDHEFFLPIWDIAHRLQLVLKDARNVESWLNNQAQIVGNVMKQYNWGIGYEQLIKIADEVHVDYLNPKSFQQTRFVQSELMVYKAFQRDFKLFFTDVQQKRMNCISKGNNTEAKAYSLELKLFTDPDFIYKLLATIDILELFTKFSCTVQNVNAYIWTIFDYFDILMNTLNEMKTEMKNGEISEKNFPLLFETIEGLKNNLYQDCLLIADDCLRKTKSHSQAEENIPKSECFKLPRKKIENLCSVIIKQLKQRISEPNIVKHMRKCFSSKHILSPTPSLERELNQEYSTPQLVENSLQALTEWVSKNRKEFKFDNEKTLLNQWTILKKNILKTEFIKKSLILKRSHHF